MWAVFTSDITAKGVPSSPVQWEWTLLDLFHNSKACQLVYIYMSRLLYACTQIFSKWTLLQKKPWNTTEIANEALRETSELKVQGHIAGDVGWGWGWKSHSMHWISVNCRFYSKYSTTLSVSGVYNQILYHLKGTQNDEVQEILTKVRGVIVSFHRSTTATPVLLLLCWWPQSASSKCVCMLLLFPMTDSTGS